ncbi:DUF6290 family protein [bacterium]|nr:DUF6290 family protein [bacterium]
MATSIRLKPEIEDRLNHLALITGRTKAFYLRELIEGGIDDLEDTYLADNIMEKIHRGTEKVYSSEELRKILSLDK